MGFRDNILHKIRIDQLARQVRRSIGQPGSGQRLDQDAMRSLLELGQFEHRRERDLNLYLIDPGTDKQTILVLDNELKIFATSVDDVVLRKSPTVKEMISIRNAIKILNDSKVVVHSKAATVDRIQTKLLDGLDLSFSGSDIDALVNDGSAALDNKYEERLIEILTIFADLLRFVKAPKPFQIAHHLIWGPLHNAGSGETVIGPLVIYNRTHGLLTMIESKISDSDKAAIDRFHGIAKGESDIDLKGQTVLQTLRDLVMRSTTAQS